MKIVDLFSGCGGMSLGFQNQGFTVVKAFDKWKPAVEVYRENFHHPIVEADLREEEFQQEIMSLEPQIIIGGPPCQDFSSAGKRDDTLGRADLTITYAEIVSKALPEWFVMENVARITKSHILTKAVDILKEAGYGITMKVLDASLCGVPQARKRFFMVGRLGESDDFLMPYFMGNLSKKRMTLRDYFGDSLGIEHYYRHPRSYMRRGVFSIDEASPTIRGVNRPVPKGYPGHPGDTADISKVRSLTIKERSYIQTFPEDFKFFGTKTNLNQIIGNAVPVKLAEYVANCINQYNIEKETKPYPRIDQMKMVLNDEETVYG